MSESTPQERQAIIDLMAPMFAQARERGLVFQNTTYDDHIIYTPDELERQMKGGNFCWGPPNWVLVKPAPTQAELLHQARVEGVDAAMKMCWPTVVASTGIADREWVKSKRDQIIATLPRA